MSSRCAKDEVLKLRRRKCRFWTLFVTRGTSLKMWSLDDARTRQKAPMWIASRHPMRCTLTQILADSLLTILPVCVMSSAMCLRRGTFVAQPNLLA
ncbi:hypothetical protein HBI81_110010 [Parastagonospora nodorum]|nr:hypothetical protein HBI45_120520 [Parastagonospora nodorum]KAH6014908.1 hypothetical protein HBI82_114380 [Parastagonospora nodorum]KAH6407533.1 hypothetical protein HBI14_162410 [Parastagonospora nodorum]KAH6528636.1 hypothetical protein HBI81_110010 [Parastagonospora nodorum]